MRRQTSLSSKARIVIVFMVLALLFQVISLQPKGWVAPLGPDTAEAYDFLGALSNVVPFAGLVKAVKVRNRVYKEANTFIDEEKDYHDRLQAKAREMFINRDLAIDSRSQTGSYMKVSVLIHQERQASLDFAESKKKAAREEFIDKFEKAIIMRIINSGAAQELIKALSAGLRAAQGKLDGVVDALAGNQGGLLADVAKFRRQASRLQAISGVIGGRGGQKISGAMGRIVGFIDRTTGTFSVPISQVSEELGSFAEDVEGLETANMLAGGAETPNEFVTRLVDANEDDPVLDAILGVFDTRYPDNPSIREEARQKILIGFIMRCARMGSELREVLSQLATDMDPEFTPGEERQSRCQAVADLLAQDAEEAVPVDELLSAEEEPDGELSDEALKIVSLETKDGWCFPKGEHSENHICGYTVDWIVEYSSPADVAPLECYVLGVDYYNSKTFRTMRFQTPTGLWEESLDAGGFYPDLGEYPEKFICELKEAQAPYTQPIFQVEVDITAPLTELRQP